MNPGMTLKDKLIDAEHYLEKYKLKLKEKLGLFDTAIIYPYRGYGTDRKAVLKGRVLEQEKTIHGDEARDEGVLHNALRFFKRYESDEIPGVNIHASFAGCEQTVTSNADGFFEFTFDYDKKPSPGWHEVTLRLVGSEYDLPIRETSTGEIFIPEDSPDFGIISDVDDTLIESNATNLMERIVTMMKHTARSRPVFEGAKELYDELTGEKKNPLWFVSGSSYNLHDLLIELAEYNELPKAPFMLRDLGLDDTQWVKRDTHKYKMMQLEHLLDMYPDLNFILIGDSGQQDPEIYRQVIENYPQRIRAVYIRHVTGTKREKEIQQIAENLELPLTLFCESKEAISHCRSEGFIG
jgi:phosphatidate phosphatase APP1